MIARSANRIGWQTVTGGRPVARTYGGRMAIDGPRVITAKYPGTCRECRSGVEPGQPIEHQRGVGIRCMRCVNAADHTPAPVARPYYGAVDRNGEPVKPKPAPAERAATPTTTARRRRTYAELFPDDED